MRARRVSTCVLFVWGFLVSASTDAAAQPSAAPSRSWTVEVHGGAVTGAGPVSGHGQLPPPGEPYTVAVLFPSRRVPSWFFGDGTLLFNQHRVALSPLQVPIPAMVPLDDMLQGGIVRDGAGGAFGARLARSLGARFGLEFTADLHGNARQFTDAVRPAVELTRKSYSDALNAYFARSSIATTELTITEGFGSELVIAGALNITLTRSARLESYATIGAGAVQALGDAPSLTLIGHNRPTSGDQVLLDETDMLTITTDPRPGAAIVMGGGLLRPIGERGGIRIDARVHVIQDRTVTHVTTAPSIGSDFPLIVVRAATPTVVFSASPLLQPSLSVALTDFETFTGSGSRTQFSFTAGYFFRF